MENEFYKLMNNSLYVKTCENQAKRSDIRLLAHPTEFMKLLSKPQCEDVRMFNEFLVALNLNKVEITFNKPFYVGFSVLKLSKLHMYKYVRQHFIIPVPLIFRGAKPGQTLE